MLIIRPWLLLVILAFQLSTVEQKPSITKGGNLVSGGGGKVSSLPEMTPAQKLQYREAIEKRFQEIYGNVVPGVRVHAFMRNDEFMLLIEKGTRMAPVIYLIDATDVDNPKTKLRGVLVYPKWKKTAGVH